MIRYDSTLYLCGFVFYSVSLVWWWFDEIACAIISNCRRMHYETSCSKSSIPMWMLTMPSNMWTATMNQRTIASIWTHWVCHQKPFHFICCLLSSTFAYVHMMCDKRSPFKHIWNVLLPQFCMQRNMPHLFWTTNVIWQPWHALHRKICKHTQNHTDRCRPPRLSISCQSDPSRFWPKTVNYRPVRMMSIIRWTAHGANGNVILVRLHAAAW